MPANVYECMFILDSTKVSGNMEAADKQIRVAFWTQFDSAKTGRSAGQKIRSDRTGAREEQVRREDVR